MGGGGAGLLVLGPPWRYRPLHTGDDRPFLMLFPGSHCLLVMMLMFLTSMYQAGSYLVAPTQSLKKAKRHKNTARLLGCGKNTSPYQNYARYIPHRGMVYHITVKEFKSMPFCKLIPLLLSSSPG